MSNELDANLIIRVKELLQTGIIDWTPNIQSREAGEFDLPAKLVSLFKKDQMETVASKRAVAQFYQKYPEPKGGHLRSQFIDSQVHPGIEVRKRDEFYQELQGSILATIRPLISLFDKIDSLAEDGPEKNELNETISDTIKFVQHVAGKLRIHRRIGVAKDLNLCPHSDAHYRIGSSDDSQLFGPELRAALEEERKALPKGKPSSGNGPTGRLGRLRGGLKWRQSTGRNTRSHALNTNQSQAQPQQ